MKRSVAIKGPTPAFVRWAIERPCPLRPIGSPRFVDGTFRYLRSLRELSVAVAESRCVDGFGIHPDAFATDGLRSSPEQIEGFDVDEIVAPFGGRDAVQSACGSCAANVVQLGKAQPEDSTIERLTGLVGCYGFLTTNGVALERILSGHSGDEELEEFDLVASLFRTASREPERLERLRELFDGPETVFNSPAGLWHSIWKSEGEGEQRRCWETRLNRDQLIGLAELLREQLEEIKQSNRVNALQGSLSDLVAAIECCQRESLALVVELIPSGFSDGSHWQLDPSCPNCRFVPETLVSTDSSAEQNDAAAASPYCGGCGKRTHWVPGPKFKVLGRRPYMRLVDIVGIEGVKQLQLKLHSLRKGAK